MIFDSKNYTYTVSNCNLKQLKNKINYAKSIDSNVEINLDGNNIVVKKKNTGRKNNSAFVGTISECGSNCKITGSFPDERNMKLMLVFVAVWYAMFVGFTFGKMDTVNMVVSYTIGAVFIIGLVSIFLITQSKTSAVIKKFISDIIGSC